MNTKILALPIFLSLSLVLASGYKFKGSILKKPITTINPLTLVVQKQPLVEKSIFTEIEEIESDEIVQAEDLFSEETLPMEEQEQPKPTKISDGWKGPQFYSGIFFSDKSTYLEWRNRYHNNHSKKKHRY
ncbi:MAG: hypothetical protein K1000chlam2_01099 [Chlamydiae bacterium]|nr:hypothetical protein [Chlamydiota bacterium]